MKDTECAETKEKLIFRFLCFLVFEIWSILYSTVVNSELGTDSETLTRITTQKTFFNLRKINNRNK